MSSLIGIILGLLAALGFGWMARRPSKTDRLRIEQERAEAETNRRRQEAWEESIARDEAQVQQVDQELDTRTAEEKPVAEMTEEELDAEFEKRGL